MISAIQEVPGATRVHDKQGKFSWGRATWGEQKLSQWEWGDREGSLPKERFWWVGRAENRPVSRKRIEHALSHILEKSAQIPTTVFFTRQWGWWVCIQGSCRERRFWPRCREQKTGFCWKGSSLKCRKQVQTVPRGGKPSFFSLHTQQPIPVSQ